MQKNHTYDTKTLSLLLCRPSPQPARTLFFTNDVKGVQELSLEETCLLICSDLYEENKHAVWHTCLDLRRTHADFLCESDTWQDITALAAPLLHARVCAVICTVPPPKTHISLAETAAFLSRVQPQQATDRVLYLGDAGLSVQFAVALHRASERKFQQLTSGLQRLGVVWHTDAAAGLKRLISECEHVKLLVCGLTADDVREATEQLEERATVVTPADAPALDLFPTFVNRMFGESFVQQLN